MLYDDLRLQSYYSSNTDTVLSMLSARVLQKSRLGSSEAYDVTAAKSILKTITDSMSTSQRLARYPYPKLRKMHLIVTQSSQALLNCQIACLMLGSMGVTSARRLPR